MYKYKVDKYKTKYFKLVGGLNLDNLPLNNSTNTRGPVPTQQENAINNLYQLRRNNV